ncbi:hypothetical protein LX36DRAFT_35991 [Colletotrichum falcatum]|nr:hypothetical protein LX36DRAFT_35991 [Colletotrichum falcatum]
MVHSATFNRRPRAWARTYFRASSRGLTARQKRSLSVRDATMLGRMLAIWTPGNEIGRFEWALPARRSTWFRPVAPQATSVQCLSRPRCGPKPTSIVGWPRSFPAPAQSVIKALKHTRSFRRTNSQGLAKPENTQLAYDVPDLATGAVQFFSLVFFSPSSSSTPISA